jgi:hypothetical protein
MGKESVGKRAQNRGETVETGLTTETRSHREELLMNEINHTLLMILGLSKASADIVMDRITELENELHKCNGIIARNAMQRLQPEDGPMCITSDDIKDSLEIHSAYQKKS